MRAKATAIDKEHGVIRAVAPLVDRESRPEYERRRNLIFTRVGDFRNGEPRIDRCPCCGRRVMILRDPDDLGRHTCTLSKQRHRTQRQNATDGGFDPVVLILISGGTYE
mmetsp:Transcript_10566/g.31806  ORF Transcript_10566/g.31806 Transcript_10566/m.31806 type:complete len:109 (-) Transcript_10566:16-342(-)